MNRRSLFKKAAALAVVPLGYVGVKMAQQPNLNQVCASPCMPPAYVPPPEDTRTPQQVIEDQRKEQLEDSIRGLVGYPGQRHWHMTRRVADFQDIHQALVARNIPFQLLSPEAGIWGGLIVSGNVLTIL